MESHDRKPTDSPQSGPTRRQSLEHRLRDTHADRDAYLELAGIYREENKPQLAAKVLEKGYEIFPDDAVILWDWEEARLSRSMQQLAEVREMVARTKSALAEQELERARTNWAMCRIQVCRARISRDDEKNHLRLVLTEALYELERYDEALDEITPLADSEQHGCHAALWQGRCHLILGRDIEAMTSLRNACLRRSVTTHAKVRIAALKLLIDLADRHGLTATLELYQTTLASVIRSNHHSPITPASPSTPASAS